MIDYIGVPGDGPGRCEHDGCTEPGDTHGFCADHAVKGKVLAALREQVTEADRHIGEPGYSIRDCERNARSFADVADWLDDNWDEVTA